MATKKNTSRKRKAEDDISEISTSDRSKSVRKRRKRTTTTKKKDVPKKKRLPPLSSIVKPAYSSWINFCMHRRPQMKSDPKLQDRTFGEISALLSKEWNSMSEESKQPYKLMHQSQKREREQAVSSLQGDQKRTFDAIMRKRRAKRREKPKTSLSAYMCFVKHERENVRQKYCSASQLPPKEEFKLLGKILGKMWSEMSVEEREPYEELSRTDKLRYESEKIAYERQKKLDQEERARLHEARKEATMRAKLQQKKSEDDDAI
jgi:hypothetical protein